MLYGYNKVCVVVVSGDTFMLILAGKLHWTLFLWVHTVHVHTCPSCYHATKNLAFAFRSNQSMNLWWDNCQKKNNNKQTNKQTTNTHKIISEQATDPTQSLALQSARKDSSRGKNSKILDYVVLEASEFSKLPQSCRINSKQNQTQLTDSHGLGNPQVEHLAKIAPRFIGNKILPSCQYSPSS